MGRCTLLGLVSGNFRAAFCAALGGFANGEANANSHSEAFFI